MSEEVELYTGPDRGIFRVMRLLDNSGVKLGAHCRLKDVSVFNYLSDLQYAIVGYSIEWWENDKPAPYAGGDAHPFIPRNRPNISKLYFRTKTALTPNQLYLEDAIINDFLNKKMMNDSMTYLTFSMEAAEQVASAAEWRQLRETEFEYANAVHITKQEATSSTPLTTVAEGLRFDYRRISNPDDVRTAEIKPHHFVKLRNCYYDMEDYINNEVENGRF